MALSDRLLREHVLLIRATHAERGDRDSPLRVCDGVVAPAEVVGGGVPDDSRDRGPEDIRDIIRLDVHLMQEAGEVVRRHRRQPLR